MKPNLQPKICKSPVVAWQLYHMYASQEKKSQIATLVTDSAIPAHDWGFLWKLIHGCWEEDHTKHDQLWITDEKLVIIKTYVHCFVKLGTVGLKIYDYTANVTGNKNVYVKLYIIHKTNVFITAMFYIGIYCLLEVICQNK